MNKTWKIVIALFILVFIGAMAYYYWTLVPRVTAPEPQLPTGEEINETPVVADLSDMIRVTSPLEDALVGSPLVVTGQARGGWYFEASFPVRLVDGNGNLLGQVAAAAQSDWMTEDFVPFTASIVYDKPETETGTIILMNDNASGLPENDKEISIPVRFNLSATEGWRARGGCVVTGCSGQVCADEDTITTCEFKTEYLCYRNAICERGVDGKCGWKMTEELLQCFANAGAGKE
ncbi:MAG: Gmad2 immunoglobulin-like domain-containing protein [Patescibacteria group bacterium]|nr:Gmad2 immunoglobulin-like domain-containing protein [Patescibacteria group bacterium]